jgi:predicted DNA binding CopG/RHH family protein
MNGKFKIPKFDSEAEEAQWWFDHREDTAKLMQEAAAAGETTNLATILRNRREGGATPTVSIRIDPADLSRARALAERRGLRYQTYLKMLLHEALEREDQRLPG